MNESGRRLSVDVWVGGDNDFHNGLLSEPGEELRQLDIVRADTIQRADDSVKDVVQASEFPRFFYGDHIGGALHHTDG